MQHDFSATVECNQILKYMRNEREIEERKKRY